MLDEDYIKEKVHGRLITEGIVLICILIWTVYVLSVY